jgi:hypothetical protein
VVRVVGRRGRVIRAAEAAESVIDPKRSDYHPDDGRRVRRDPVADRGHLRRDDISRASADEMCAGLRKVDDVAARQARDPPRPGPIALISAAVARNQDVGNSRNCDIARKRVSKENVRVESVALLR